MTYTIRTLPAALLCALTALNSAQAAAPAGTRSYEELALNGAGDRIAALESVNPPDASKRAHTSVVVRDAGGKLLAQYDPCKACLYNFPSWSPDGKLLSFIGNDSKSGMATLYLVSNGKTAAVTKLRGVANTARWAPDGKRLALLATIGAKKSTGATEAGAPQVGELGTDEDEQRIAVVDRNGGPLRLVSPGDTFIYEYDWMPDGSGFVVTSAKGNGDNNWWVATLGQVDAASGALRILAAPKMQLSMPKVSQDGKTVAYIGGLMSDFGSVGGDVYTLPLAGGEPVDITPNYAGSFNGLDWRGGKLLATAQIGAEQAVVALDAANGKHQVLWSQPATMGTACEGCVSLSADGSIAATALETFDKAPHIVAGRLPQLAAITHDNDSLPAAVAARSITWTSDQFQVQGWLLAPLKVDASKRHPMAVIIHGGPAAAATPYFIAPGKGTRGLIRDLSHQGYFVFLPNPRGSYGQGLAFSSANKRDMGGGDWRDILAGIDAVEAVAPVDDQRLALLGHSYGGFMTMWGVTHSQRFKAAVAGAGIANWISYYGQNGIDQWMIPFFGHSAYDDPAIYRAASPIESIKAARTPTLITVGERDVECPPAQSVEFWHGLKAMGTPTSLVIYPGEGHAFQQPANRADERARTLAWLARYVK
jgi:dipeptidyl aminopeptidase/acylaminoacyl peptidase